MALFFVIIFCPQPASAGTTKTIYVESDTYVWEKYPGSNYGSNPYLRVRSEENSNQRVYLSFGLGEIPNNAQISSAILNLYLHEVADSAIYRVYRVAAYINEGNLTWNNQPGPLTDWYAELTIGDWSGPWVSWDVTRTIDLTALTNDYVSYLIRCKDESSSTARYCKFLSRDYSPSYVYLQITYNTPPTLTGGRVTPTSAPWGSTFTFEVTYADADRDSPYYVQVFIDGLPLPMTRVGYSTDWRSGVTYNCSWGTSSMNLGDHSYFFKAHDGALETTTAMFRGPKVTKKSSTITLDVPSQVELESTINISGTISPAGKEVTLKFTKPNGQTLTRTAPAPAGSFSCALSGEDLDIVGSWEVLASWEGDELYLGDNYSRFFEVTKISTTITAELSGRRAVEESIKVRANKSITISGSINPPLGGVPVTLKFQIGGNLVSEQVTSSSGGSYSYVFTPEALAKSKGMPWSVGNWFVTTEWPGNERYQGDSSETYSFVVLPPLFVETYGVILASAGVALLVALILAWKRAMKISMAPPPPPPKPTEELEFEIPGRTEGPKKPPELGEIRPAKRKEKR